MNDANKLPFDQTISAFIAEAASDSPTPGGGSIAALTAALGAAMASMVASLTKGAKFAHVEADMTQASAEMKAVIGGAETLLAADVAAFEAYMAALKLPKADPRQQELRRSVIGEAATQAAEVPLRLIRLCRDGLRTAERIAGDVNAAAVSDLGVCAILLEASARSAQLMCESNFPYIRAAETTDAIRTELADLIDEIGARADRTRRTIGLRMKG